MTHACLLLLLLMCLCATAPACAAQVVVTVDPDKAHQTIDGFGASGAWWAQGIGGWPEQERDRVLDLLYTDQGADLSIYRYNIGAGLQRGTPYPWRKTETFETAAGVYDWSKDANAVRVMRQVRRRGVDRFVFFANSPPARMTVSGLASGGEAGAPNLKPDSYGAFATYCVDIAEHWRRELKLAEAVLSPINEPQWHWGRDHRNQEGCHYTPGQTVEALRAVARQIAQRRAPLRLEGPEAGQWGEDTLAYVRAILDDDEVAGALHQLAVHSYFSDNDQRRRLRALVDERRPELPIAMTEWCQMQRGRDAGMASALTLAGVMHEDLTLGRVVSWQKWIAVSPYDFHDGLIYIDRASRRITPTKRLWVMANFSRFVRPGDTRVASSDDSAWLRTVAFRSADGGRIACVVINSAPKPKTIRIDAAGFEASGAHTTSDEMDLQPRQVNGAALRLPPRSVTTVLLTKREG